MVSRITYILLTCCLVCSKIILSLPVVGIGLGSCSDSEPIVSRVNVPASDYRTSEDFYKLTGVEFPELGMVDSLFYNENCIRANMWSEYKFVAPEGLDESFCRRLERAYEADSTHWKYDEESRVYRYWIYPDQHPVDRSRGMCDRVVECADGSLTKDWDGDFVSVEIQRDTIVLRKGWLR